MVSYSQYTKSLSDRELELDLRASASWDDQDPMRQALVAERERRDQD